MRKTILLLDADQRSALSVTRSLARLNRYRIITAGVGRWDMCRFSRYSKQFFLYRDPRVSRPGFARSLQAILARARPDWVFPCTDATLTAIYHSHLYPRLQHRLLAPERETYFKASDKAQVNRLAKSLGIRTAETVIPPPTRFPLVVKPPKSWYLSENGLVRGFRTVVKNKEEFREAMQATAAYESKPLLQEFVPGRGFGVFVGAKEGAIFASFAHQRIREFPLEGGNSCMRKSIPVNPHLLEASRRLVSGLHWSGIAMIEFKGLNEQTACLMEINARPWGSMDLAVCSGVDFPQMNLDIFGNRMDLEDLRVKYGGCYKIGHQSRWLIGELVFLMHIMKSETPPREKLLEALRVAGHNPRNTSYDTFRLNDPLPLAAEIVAAGVLLRNRGASGAGTTGKTLPPAAGS